MHFNCAEVQLKIYLVYFIVLKWNYCKHTSGTLYLYLHLKSDIIQRSYNPNQNDIKTHFRLNIKKSALCISMPSKVLKFLYQ